MRAILLCAGFGTRMHPVTHDCPKALLEVADKPVIEYLLNQLVRFPHLNDIHIVTNDLYHEQFADWSARIGVGLMNRGIELHLHNDGAQSNQDRLGAICDLEYVLTSLGVPDHAFVAASDSIYRFELLPIWEEFLDTRQSHVIALRETYVAKLRRTGVLELGEADRVLRFHEKPEEPMSTWSCPAVYFLTGEALSRVRTYLGEKRNQDAPGHFISYLVGKEPVYAHKVAGTRFHMGTVKAFQEADRVLREEPVIAKEKSEAGKR